MGVPDWDSAMVVQGPVGCDVGALAIVLWREGGRVNLELAAKFKGDGLQGCRQRVGDRARNDETG